MTTFEIIFLICWAIYFFVLYAPHMRQIRRERVSDNRSKGGELPLSLLAFFGMQILPLIYIFSTWLDFANYTLPNWLGWLGAVIFALALLITRKAHVDLGRNWTPTVQVKESQTLITGGIYARVRHPIYLAQWMWCIAQALLLHNWIAGLAGLIGFAPIYFYRVPREEKMMLEHFGAAYKNYMKRVGGIIPK